MTVTREEIDAGRLENLKIRGGSGKVASLTRRKKPRKPRATPRVPDPDMARFRLFCHANGLPLPVTEYRFAAPERRWRFDYAWVEEKVALEVEGGVWSGGRHTRGSGYLQDMEKYNNAALRGWVLLRCTPKQLITLETLEMVKQALNQRSAA